MYDSLITVIKNGIHDLITTETGIYSCLCFSSLDKIKDFTFNFNFSLTNETILDSDIKFFMDNVISKIFEINYNVDYRTTSRLGGNITCNNIITKNDFIINDYEFIEQMNILSLEDYLDDITIKTTNEICSISLTLPIYKLDKNKIIVS